MTTNPSDDIAPGSDQSPPNPGQPGAGSVPTGSDGGDTGAGRRVDGGPPEPASNQAKTEPVPPTGAHAAPDAAQQSDPDDVPDEAGTLSSMDPQSARVGGLLPPVTAPSDGPTARPSSIGSDPVAEKPAHDVHAGPGGTGSGHERPAQHTEGDAHRAPGSLGSTPEPIETDLDTSAARVQPGSPPESVPPADDGAGDTAGVSMPGMNTAAAGTSEESSVVEGARTPSARDLGT